MHLFVDALVSWLHFTLIFVLVATLAAELVLCRAPLTPEAVRRLTHVDTVYGAASLLLLVVGFARAMAYGKGWAFYSAQPWFWIKIATFAAVGLISIIPTVQFIRWRRAVKQGAGLDAPEGRIKKIRAMIHLELTLLLVISFAAAMMARGL